jgi:hypothetical protein
MFNSTVIATKNPARNWILSGIPILFIAGFFMHYIYEWSGCSVLVGIFAPVNESIWEHLKLAFWPMLIWWIMGYVILCKKNKISAAQWFTSCAVAELICPLVIICFYYTYTGAFGIESLILDIFSLFLGISVAQGLALHVYNYAGFSRYCLYISTAIIILLAIAFTVFTFAPPHIPLFEDPLTGNYGI